MLLFFSYLYVKQCVLLKQIIMKLFYLPAKGVPKIPTANSAQINKNMIATINTNKSFNLEEFK